MQTRTVILLCSFILFGSAFAAPAPAPTTVASSEFVPDEYIVVLKTESRVRSNADHINYVKSLMDTEFANDKTSVNLEYDFGTWQAYQLTGPKSLADKLTADADVDWVQPVRVSKALGANRNPTPGLRRSSSRNLPAANAPYLFPDSAGSGVDVYVVDTGIRIDHPEFEGRAILGFSAFSQNIDENGHGTHVSGTIGSKSFGMAPKATLIAVRVLDADGSGRNDGILAGLDFVRRSAAQRRNPSVVNMSLGGPADRALDRVVNTLVNAGITVVVAAGNDGADACGDSPARVPSAITVGAVDPRTDSQAQFSNTGTCVDINAPGVNIKSTWIGNSATDGEKGKTNTISGTSMASPHVAGAVALLLADQRTLKPAQVADLLLKTATPNVLRVRNQTPNLLLFNGGAAGFSTGKQQPIANPVSVLPEPVKQNPTTTTTRVVRSPATSKLPAFPSADRKETPKETPEFTLEDLLSLLALLKKSLEPSAN